MGSVDADPVMPKPRSSKSDDGGVGEGSRSEVGVRRDRQRLSAYTMRAAQRLRNTGLAVAHGASRSDGSRTRGGGWCLA
jgi:hypothetical protein